MGSQCVLLCVAWMLLGVILNVILENPASCHPARLGAKHEKRDNTINAISTKSHWAQHVPGFGGRSSIHSPMLVLFG